MRHLAVVLLALPLAATAQGPPAKSDALRQRFLDLYLPNVSLLEERYVHNRRVRGTIRFAEPDVNARESRVRAVSEFETDSDHRNMLLHAVESQPLSGVSGWYHWLVWTPDHYHVLGRAGDGHGLVLRERTVAAEQPVRHRARRDGFRLTLPMRYQDTYTVDDFFHRWTELPLDRFEVRSITPTLWQGHAVVEVRLGMVPKPGYGEESENWLYFDPAHAWILRGVEFSRGRPGSPMKRSAQEIHYFPSAEGYPLPTRFVKYVDLLDGKRLLEEEVEIHEYSRATAGPETFELDRLMTLNASPPQRLGHAMPANSAPGGVAIVGPDAPPAVRSDWPLWLAAVGAAAVVLWFVWPRRRNTARPFE